MTCLWSLSGNAIVQGIAEPAGTYWAEQMQAYGTPLVAGVSAGYGGDRLGGVPVFDLVEQALAATATVTTSIIFSNPYQALDDAREAIAAGIRQLVLATSDLPPLDMLQLLEQATATETRLLGPGQAGIILPGQLMWGMLATECYQPGKIALLSRSQGLLDELAAELTNAGFGQSLAVELGGGATLGSQTHDWLPWLARDRDTQAIALIEHHLSDTRAAAEFIPKTLDKPLVAYVAGHTIAPSEPPQEAAAQIASQFVAPSPHTNTAAAKIAAYQKARIPVAQQPAQLAELLDKALK